MCHWISDHDGNDDDDDDDDDDNDDGHDDDDNGDDGDDGDKDVVPRSATENMMIMIVMTMSIIDEYDADDDWWYIDVMLGLMYGKILSVLFQT